MSSSPTSSGPTATGEFTTGAVLLLLTVIVWGVQFPIAKHVFETVNAFHAAVFRFSLAALILAIALWLREGRQGYTMAGEHWHVVYLGVIGMCAGPALIFGGLMFTRPEIAAVVVATQPLITVLLQRLMSRKNPDLISLICVLTAFLGVVTVVTRWDSSFRFTGSEWIGDLMILLGAICWVMYTIGLERYQSWSSLKVTCLTMLVGSFTNILLVLSLLAMGLITNPSLADWYQVRWGLLFLALVGVLGAMFGWNLGSRRVGALNAILFINLIPVVTFLVRYWQGYALEAIEILGAAIVISALLAQNLYARSVARRTALSQARVVHER